MGQGSSSDSASDTSDDGSDSDTPSPKASECTSAPCCKWDSAKQTAAWSANKCTLVYNLMLNISQAESFGALVVAGYTTHCITSSIASVKRVCMAPPPWPLPVIGCLPGSTHSRV